MKRKLISVLLCAFALLLLMGAGVAPQKSAAILAEEESAAPSETAPGTEAEGSPAEPASPAEDNDALPDTDVQDQGNEEETVPPEAPEEENAPQSGIITVDGVEIPADMVRFCENGVTYIALSAMSQVLDPSAETEWNSSDEKVTVKTKDLEIIAKMDDLYMVANGRYLYAEDGIQMVEDCVVVPLTALVKAFDAKLVWDPETGNIAITRGSGAILSGDEYYDEESLFWLSRIITAESNNQPLKGQVAVGNVVLNRVADPVFPNTVKEVLSQKNQFSPYKNGKLADRKPSVSSTIAAKLALDGGEVREVQGSRWFDGSNNSWAAKNKEFAARIGGHNFYR